MDELAVKLLTRLKANRITSVDVLGGRPLLMARQSGGAILFKFENNRWACIAIDSYSFDDNPYISLTALATEDCVEELFRMKVVSAEEYRAWKLYTMTIEEIRAKAIMDKEVATLRELMEKYPTEVKEMVDARKSG